MLNLLFIVVCLGIGWLFARFELLPANSHKLINKLLVWIFIPALNFKYLATLSFTSAYLYPLITPWLLFLGAIAFFCIAKGVVQFSKQTLGALILTGGIGSISFVGFPIFQLYYGDAGMAMGIIMSQLGTFLVAMTLGIAIATILGRESKKPSDMLKSMLGFPPLVSMFLALFVNFLTDGTPSVLTEMASLISQPFAFLALFAVGLQINFTHFLKDKKLLFVGLGYKLVVCPVVIFCYFYFNEELSFTEAKISLLGASLGPMNTAAIIAEDFGLNGALAAKMVSVGIPVSIISTLIIQYLL